MKSLVIWVLSLALLASPGWANAEPAREFLALMSFGGTQSGGDEAAFIDEAGGIYYIDMEAEGLYWQGEETISMLRALPDAYKVGALEAAGLEELRRLIEGIEITEPTAYGVAACDAGTLRQVVYREAEGGAREEITLMTAGDSVRENMDKNAMILSSELLDLMAFTKNLRRKSYLFPYGDSVPRAISFERGSFTGGSRTCTLTREGDTLRFYAQGANGDETNASGDIDDAQGYFYDTALITQLQEIIDRQNIAAWDGFDERDKEVLDGDGFSLSIDYATHSITASGYERYPERYAAAARELDAFFDKLIARAGEPLIARTEEP